MTRTENIAFETISNRNLFPKSECAVGCAKDRLVAFNIIMAALVGRVSRQTLLRVPNGVITQKVTPYVYYLSTICNSVSINILVNIIFAHSRQISGLFYMTLSENTPANIVNTVQ